MSLAAMSVVPIAGVVAVDVRLPALAVGGAEEAGDPVFRRPSCCDASRSAPSRSGSNMKLIAL